MSTKITADNGAEIQVGRLGITVDHPEGIASIWARLSPWQRRSLADALDQDAAVVIGGRLTASESQYKRERDAAVERAEHLEREVSKVEGRASEWSIKAQEWRVRAEAAEARPWTIALDDKASPVFMPAVTRDEIEKVVEAAFAREAGYGLGSDKPWPGTQPVASAVWDYLKGGDPAVYVVRESDLPDLELVAARNFDLANGQTKFRDATADEVDEAVDGVASDLRYVLAARRSIEAEQAEDPAEELTDNLADILYGDELVTDQMRGVLERVVRAGMLFPSEATSDE